MLALFVTVSKIQILTEVILAPDHFAVFINSVYPENLLTGWLIFLTF